MLPQTSPSFTHKRKSQRAWRLVHQHSRLQLSAHQMGGPQMLQSRGLHGRALGRFLRKAPSVLVFSRYSINAPSVSLRFSLPSLLMRLLLSSQIRAQEGRERRGRSRGSWEQKQPQTHINK